MNADEHGWAVYPTNSGRGSVVVLSALLLGAAHPACASRLWHWSCSGAGVSASGTFTTDETADAQGFYRITGITGKPEDVAAMAKSFGIFSRKVPLEGGDYTMDHTASVLLLDAKGDFAGTIAYEENAGAALAKLRRLANES